MDFPHVSFHGWYLHACISSSTLSLLRNRHDLGSHLQRSRTDNLLRRNPPTLQALQVHFHILHSLRSNDGSRRSGPAVAVADNRIYRYLSARHSYCGPLHVANRAKPCADAVHVLISAIYEVTRGYLRFGDCVHMDKRVISERDILDICKAHGASSFTTSTQTGRRPQICHEQDRSFLKWVRSFVRTST